jgi:hypothetical protein
MHPSPIAIGTAFRNVGNASGEGGAYRYPTTRLLHLNLKTRT